MKYQLTSTGVEIDEGGRAQYWGLEADLRGKLHFIIRFKLQSTIITTKKWKEMATARKEKKGVSRHRAVEGEAYDSEGEDAASGEGRSKVRR